MLSDKTLKVLTAIINNEIREKAYIRSIQTGVVENGILQQMDLEIADLHAICYQLINFKSNLQKRDISIVKTSLGATAFALKAAKVAN
ncbi:hypothetical protein [Pseudoalteromonas piratica]|uniref:Uncharacterized protein n=1 Tax=Pseudoalteromonas piratica TaxID=1348114 RepID=A0A0A7EKD7_9GAMM|nr:hypothetical protein [Pseudoalteromonas piratica]AIY67089.1 hypothetical protein OM33_18630 [Pseudoalteromonas piratica]